MKILMIGPLTNGGRERRMAQLIVGLDKYPQHEITLLVPGNKFDYKEVLSTNTRIITIKNTVKKELYDTVKNVVHETSPDIVHLWIEEIHWFTVVQRLRIKYRFKYIAGFVASGVVIPFCSRDHFAFMLGYYHADAVVSNSKAGLIARRAPSRVSHVIPNGFSFSRFENAVDRKQKRKELGIDNGAFSIVMVARFDEGKDWNMFIELAKLVKQNNYSICFLAIGVGPLLEKMKSKAELQSLDNVRFLGRRNDVEHILLSCDLGVLFDTPKHSEGISNSLMESMAAGLPVVATGTGGTPELIQHGVTGFLVKEYDVLTAFSYITELYVDKEKRIRMGENAKQYVKENLSLELMTKRYVELYESLIKIKKI